MKITKVKPAGWKVETEEKIYYFGESGRFGCYCNDGFIYKDIEAFKTGKGVCYIPEYCFEDKEATKELLEGLNVQGVENCNSVAIQGYTRTDIEALCDGTGYDAEDLFHHVDWMLPETLINEWLDSKVQCDFCKQWFEETEGVWTASEEKVFLCHRCVDAIKDHGGEIIVKY